MKRMNLESLSDTEMQGVEKDVSMAIFNGVIAKEIGYLSSSLTSGGIAISGPELISANTTSDIIQKFRTLALTSYKKEQFYDSIPEFMRPFVDRVYTLTPGTEVQYHYSRMGYINDLANSINKDPLLLRSMERSLLGFFINNIMIAPEEEKTRQRISNAFLQFRVLENNVCNLYTLFCLERYGRPNYVIGIEDDGTVHKRSFRKAGAPEDELFTYDTIHSHGIIFMNLDPKISGKLIPNNTKWASDPNRLEGLSQVNAGIAGFELLRTGQENKHFHSSLPHEIIINNKSVKNMTVIDVPPNEIYFSTRFADDSISIGSMGILEEEVCAYNSDLISRAIFTNVLEPEKANFLFDLAGGIARDMFVCVERDRYYQNITPSHKKKKKKKRKQNKVIWLPRFKINLYKDMESAAQLSEKIVTLSPAHVSGHRRKAKNPSQRQINLARSLGINLTPGYTYVKEHERGGSTQKRYYKSRSAMSLLFERRAAE